MLLAALARMASGESEGLHGVSKTSRVSRDGEEAMGTARSTLSLRRLMLDTGRGHSCRQ